MRGKNRRRGTPWIRAGLLLLAGAVLLAGYNLYDGRRAARSAARLAEALEAALPAESAQAPAPAVSAAGGILTGGAEGAVPDYILNPKMDMPVETVDNTGCVGVLRIPALGLELPVIGQWSYPNLKIAPCRYSGTAYQGDLIICAHNYPAHFGNLKYLREGDGATFTDMDGNVFSYAVAEVETLRPTDMEAMESGDWDLTLFTCTIGGQTRVTVRLVRTDN